MSLNRNLPIFGHYLTSSERARLGIEALERANATRDRGGMPAPEPPDSDPPPAPPPPPAARIVPLSQSDLDRLQWTATYDRDGRTRAAAIDQLAEQASIGNKRIPIVNVLDEHAARPSLTDRERFYRDMEAMVGSVEEPPEPTDPGAALSAAAYRRVRGH